MLRRFFNPIQIAILVGITIALTLALMWIFNSPRSQPQSGQTIQITPAHQLQRKTAAQVTHTLSETDTPAPQAASPTPEPPAPSSTMTMTMRPTETPPPVNLNPDVHQEEIVLADVDLDCDGLEERLVKFGSYSTSSTEKSPSSFSTYNLALRVPAQQGYRQVWKSECGAGLYGYANCQIHKIKILGSDDCEQFMALNGIWNVYDGEWRLKIFRWDGKDVSKVLDEPGRGLESTQDPFTVSTTFNDCSSAKCRKTEVSYVWNGTEFERE